MSSTKRVDYQTMKCLVLNTTQKALLIASEGKEFWVPISVIEVLKQDGSEIVARIPIWVITRGNQRSRENAYKQAKAKQEYERSKRVAVVKSWKKALETAP